MTGIEQEFSNISKNSIIGNGFSNSIYCIMSMDNIAAYYEKNIMKCKHNFKHDPSAFLIILLFIH